MLLHVHLFFLDITPVILSERTPTSVLLDVHLPAYFSYGTVGLSVSRHSQWQSWYEVRPQKSESELDRQEHRDSHFFWGERRGIGYTWRSYGIYKKSSCDIMYLPVQLAFRILRPDSY